MKLSVKSEYALDAIFDLALHYTGPPVKIGQIAQRRAIPHKFLELILAALRQRGFVKSRRGSGGGYNLARSPEAITVGDVVRFMEGVRDTHWRSSTGEPETPFNELWRQVDEAFDEILDHTNFAAIVRDWTERRGSQAPDWVI